MTDNERRSRLDLMLGALGGAIRRLPVQELGPPMAVVAILFTVYGLTMAPTITWAHYGADGGDLVTAVVRGSLPHPPGFPTYLLLGTLFMQLPLRDPAWRMNLMSAVMAAGAAGLVVAGMGHVPPLASRKPAHTGPRRRDPRHQPHTSGVAVCAGLVLGVAPLFWSQALIAEVYAPAAFFSALVVLLVLRNSPAWLLGLVWGMGLGLHPTLVFLAPLLMWRAWNEQGRTARVVVLVQIGLVALLVWGTVYGPVLLAWAGVRSPWGDLSSGAGWWALISARIYRQYLFALPLTALPQRLLAWMGLLARQFTPVGAVLAGLGVMVLWQSQRLLALTSGLTVGLFSLYAIGYNTADSLVYLAVALPVAALWLTAGLEQAGAWLERRLPWSTWAMWLLPLAQVFFLWGRMDVSGDQVALRWAERTLLDAPPEAVLLTDRDGHLFTLWYVQGALGVRPDVAVVDVDLWAYEPYRETVEEELGVRNSGPDLLPQDLGRMLGRSIVKATGGL
jgi:hypothetical protein